MEKNLSGTTIDRTEQMAKDIIQERYGQPLKAAMILCEELEAALRAARKDAERYRCIREYPALAMEKYDPVWLGPEEIDAAVDAAIIEETKNG